MQKLRRGSARLIDAYTDGLLEKEDFERRLGQVRARIAHLEQDAQRLRDLEQEERELRLLLGRFDVFAQQVRDGLDQADWTRRREIIRALVKRVEIAPEQVRVVFRVSPAPMLVLAGPDPPALQDRVGRVLAPHLQRVGGRGTHCGARESAARCAGPWSQDRRAGQ